jgi:lipopolysaccharide export system permease protein
MWRLHRYLFQSTAAIAVASVGLLMLLFVSATIARELHDQIDDGRISHDLVRDLIPHILLYVAPWVLPIGSLVAVLVVIGRLSATSELTALKASGISLWRVAVPFVAFCLLATLFTAWITATAGPAARASYRAMIANALRADPLLVIRPKQYVHDFEGYVVYVDDKQGGLIRDVWIWELNAAETPIRLLRAEAGTLDYDVEGDALVLRLENGFVELRDADDPNDLSRPQPSLFFDQVPIRLPLGDILGGETARAVRVANLPLDQKLARLDELQRRAALATPEEQSRLAADIMEVKFKIQAGFATAFSVLSLGLLAIPLGVKASRRETTTNVFMAFGLVLLYYSAITIIGWFDKSPHLRPDLLVWLPNLVAQILAAWLFVRVNRH